MKRSSTRTAGRAKARPVVVSVFGTRPQLVKLSAMWRPLDESFRSLLIDSGQHYDFSLAGTFYSGQRLRRPDIFLSARADTPAGQIGRIADALDSVLRRKAPDAVIVYGDTSTTAGAVIAASYRNIPVAHVEAGLRSFDMSAAEEKNRLLADRLSTWRFCPTRTAMDNLRAEGIGEGVFGVGDILFETFLQRQSKTRDESILTAWGLTPGQFYFFTCHRAETVDVPERLAAIADILLSLKSLVVFPVHPRTRRQLIQRGHWKHLRAARHIRLSTPIDHEAALALIRSARAVLTDSGGVQREAYWSKTPCLTLRDRTEWVELVQCGANRIVGLNRHAVLRSPAHRQQFGRARDPVFRRRNASSRIVAILKRRLCN